jgi:hypothetical protein
VKDGRKGLSLQQANVSMPRGSQVWELLGAYQGVLDTIGDLPLVPMVLWRHRDRGGLDRVRYLPRPRWLLRHFVVRHIDRTLASLSRRYSARAALGSAADSEQRDREAVREFQQSLPLTRPKTYLTLLIVATIVLGRPIIDRVVIVVVNGIQDNPLVRSELRRQTGDTVERLGAALSPDLTSVNQALNVLLNEGLLQVALVTLGLALSLYAVLRPFVPAFRLKRVLFNLAPELEGHRRSASARWSVSHATGIYERERRLLVELGGRPPREFPFDLVVPALVMLAPLVLGGLFVRAGLIGPRDRLVFLAQGTLMLIPASARLGWLYRTWQWRQSGRSDPYMPFEVRIRGGRAVAKVERPLGVRVLLFLCLLLFAAYAEAGAREATLWGDALTVVASAFLLSLPVIVPWWYRINRELRDLDHSYDARKSEDEPALSLVLMAVGWVVLLPPFISVFRTGRYIQRAQARAGQPETLRSPWILAPGLLLYPILFAYLQHEMNKIWAVEGEPIDPWPADPSRTTKCSTGTMPWLRGLRAKPPNRQEAAEQSVAGGVVRGRCVRP